MTEIGLNPVASLDTGTAAEPVETNPALAAMFAGMLAGQAAPPVKVPATLPPTSAPEEVSAEVSADEGGDAPSDGGDAPTDPLLSLPIMGAPLLPPPVVASVSNGQATPPSVPNAALIRRSPPAGSPVTVGQAMTVQETPAPAPQDYPESAPVPGVPFAIDGPIAPRDGFGGKRVPAPDAPDAAPVARPPVQLAPDVPESINLPAGKAGPVNPPKPTLPSVLLAPDSPDAVLMDRDAAVPAPPVAPAGAVRTPAAPVVPADHRSLAAGAIVAQPAWATLDAPPAVVAPPVAVEAGPVAGEAQPQPGAPPRVAPALRHDYAEAVAMAPVSVAADNVPIRRAARAERPVETVAPSTVSATPLPAAAAPDQPLATPLADRAVAHRLDLAAGDRWLDQLARDIAQTAGRDGQLRFQLNPEHLGSLQVELRHTAEGASVRLSADSEAARAILADARPRLIAEAQSQGVRIADAQVSGGGGQGLRQGDGQRPHQPFVPPIVSRPEAKSAATVTVNEPIAAMADRYA